MVCKQNTAHLIKTLINTPALFIIHHTDCFKQRFVAYLQEMVFCYQNCSDLCTVRKNCSSDLKIFANSRPSASNCKRFSQSLEQLFLTVHRSEQFW